MDEKYKKYKEHANRRIEYFADDCDGTKYTVVQVNSGPMLSNLVWYMYHEGSGFFFNLDIIFRAFANKKLYTIRDDRTNRPYPCFMAMDDDDEIDILWVHEYIRRKGFGTILVNNRPGSNKNISVALSKSVPFWKKMGFTYDTVSLIDDPEAKEAARLERIRCGKLTLRERMNDAARSQRLKRKEKRKREGTMTLGDKMVEEDNRRVRICSEETEK